MLLKMDTATYNKNNRVIGTVRNVSLYLYLIFFKVLKFILNINKYYCN